MIRTSLVTEPLPANQKMVLLMMGEMKTPQRATAIHRAIRERFPRAARLTGICSHLSSLVIRGLVKRVTVQSGPMRGIDLYERTGVQW